MSFVDGFSNAYFTTLNGAIDNVQTTLVVTSTTGAPATLPFRLRIKAEGANSNEIVTVTAVAGTTYTITRASEAYTGVQTASAHGDGAVVEHVFTAGALATITNGTAFIGCRLTHSTTQTVTNGATTAMALDTERFDTDGFHDTVTNNTRITIPAGLGGKYIVGCSARWTVVTASKEDIVAVRLNGTIIIAVQGVPTLASAQAFGSVEAIWDLVAGDYIEFVVQNNESGTITIAANASYSPDFWCAKLDSGKVGNGIGCSVLGTSTALTQNAYTSLAFEAADDFDTDGFHDPSSNNTRLTIPTGLAGKYILNAQASWPSSGSANTDRRLAYRLNGGTEILLSRKTYSITSQSDFDSFSAILDLVPADYIEVRQYTALTGTSTGTYSAQLMRLDSGSAAYTGPRWGSGTVFPSGPNSGDQFLRTDLNIDFFYDGTRWLSKTLYRESFGIGAAVLPITVTNVTGRFSPWHTDYSLWLDTLYCTNFISGTNDGSNFWTVTLDKETAGNVATTIGSYTTASDSASTWTTHAIALDVIFDASTYKELQIQGTKTGTAGSLYLPSALAYRLIGV